ncbi:hypothetical protein [Leptolyngbya sp. O-77]|uniref:hypothetical protein n=1 Tax=Leptolyngbya sp. O-77 TaxID=1080068 RepID=UPI00074D3F0C|nr:hypothetical protein [Leptolyngbya sp. O-77]BAU44699.1 hypothetical protein O77CONTIG1_04544 [Leptolyngbya sp. O-77]
MATSSAESLSPPLPELPQTFRISPLIRLTLLLFYVALLCLAECTWRLTSRRPCRQVRWQ